MHEHVILMQRFINLHLAGVGMTVAGGNVDPGIRNNYCQKKKTFVHYINSSRGCLRSKGHGIHFHARYLPHLLSPVCLMYGSPIFLLAQSPFSSMFKLRQSHSFYLPNPLSPVCLIYGTSIVLCQTWSEPKLLVFSLTGSTVTLPLGMAQM